MDSGVPPGPLDSVVLHLSRVPQDRLLFADMCTHIFPVSLPDPLVRCPSSAIITRMREDRTPYIGQPLEKLEDHDDVPRVEHTQLDDIDPVLD